MQLTLDGYYGRTSPEFSQRTITPLAASWAALSALLKPSNQSPTPSVPAGGKRIVVLSDGGSQDATKTAAVSGCQLSGGKPTERSGLVRVWCLDPSEQQRGASWMPNVSDWPNDASVCSLSSVLEAGPIPQTYFLSGRACAGILRRAGKRGKKLPPTLHQALEEVAQGPRESAIRADKIQ